ncbi:MAG: hypothetical protein ACHQFX_00300 [Chitinophagales bacterium]
MHIPLPLKIITGVIIVLVIVLIIAIKRKQRGLIWPLVILILLGIGFGAWKGSKEYNRRNADLGTVKADINIGAVDLIQEYQRNDSIGDLKYLGRIVEITGNVKKIELDEKGYYTVIMGDTSSRSSVRCSIDTAYSGDAAHLTAGSSANLRGACTGFNRDEMGLGSDVILNRCAIITKKE